MITADDYERDFYFRVKHPTLAWSLLEVLVRPVGEAWQSAYGFQTSTRGFSSPFSGMAPSRDDAGRIGLIQLRNTLLRFAGDDEISGRSDDQAEAAKHAANIEEMLHPAQPELFATAWERGVA